MTPRCARSTRPAISNNFSISVLSPIPETSHRMVLLPCGALFFVFLRQKSDFILAKTNFTCIIPPAFMQRAVAQAGSALRSGRRGRRFESCQLDSICISGCRLVRHFSVMSASLAPTRLRHKSPVPTTRETTFPFRTPEHHPKSIRFACARTLHSTTVRKSLFLTKIPAKDYVRSQQMVQD